MNPRPRSKRKIRLPGRVRGDAERPLAGRAAEVAEQARTYAQRAGQGYDFTAGSIPLLDRALVAKAVAPEDLDAAGAYFAEVLRAQFGGSYENRPGPVVLRIGKLRVMPLTKLRTVAQQGPADGLEAFLFVLAKRVSLEPPASR